VSAHADSKGAEFSPPVQPAFANALNLAAKSSPIATIGRVHDVGAERGKHDSFLIGHLLDVALDADSQADGEADT
jgi:hypothetical protein